MIAGILISFFYDLPIHDFFLKFQFFLLKYKIFNKLSQDQ